MGTSRTRDVCNRKDGRVHLLSGAGDASVVALTSLVGGSLKRGLSMLDLASLSLAKVGTLHHNLSGVAFTALVDKVQHPTLRSARFQQWSSDRAQS